MAGFVATAEWLVNFPPVTETPSPKLVPDSRLGAGYSVLLQGSGTRTAYGRYVRCRREVVLSVEPSSIFIIWIVGCWELFLTIGVDNRESLLFNPGVRLHMSPSLYLFTYRDVPSLDIPRCRIIPNARQQVVRSFVDFWHLVVECLQPDTGNAPSV